MPNLLSGSRLNTSSPSGFANLPQVQYQLGPTPTTSTGYTLIANSGSQVTFVSSLGNLQFDRGQVFSNLPNQNINFIGTGTGTVIVSGPMANTSTFTGALVIAGGIGIGKGFYTGEDVYINKIRVGQGDGTVNNIVISGVAQQSGYRPDGENSIVIGYDALQGLGTAENVIAIGRYALSSGSQIINTIAIGDGALQSSGTRPILPVGYVSTVTLGVSTVVTVPDHKLSTGTVVQIFGVNGTTQLNGNNYIINVLTTNTFRLYPNNDPALMFPVDSTAFGAYASSGTVVEITMSMDNIGIGMQIAPNFYNGQENIFLGFQGAPKFTTGSYNLFLGNQVSSNMTRGNNNISIYGKNLEDGVNDQISIGSLFYYNGSGYTQINSDLGIGINTEAVSTQSGTLQVSGGVGVTGSLFVYKNINATGIGTVTLSPIGTGTVIINPSTQGSMNNIEIGATTPRNSVFVTTTATTMYAVTAYDTTLYATTASVTGSVAATNSSTGALKVPNGGISTHGSIYSQDGNPDEGYLLYTPRVTVNIAPPSSPRVGDFWINLNNYGEYQWIKDGTSTFWIQIAQL